MRHNRPTYISADTQAMTIAITGPTNKSLTLGLTALSSDCTTVLGGLECSETIGLAPCSNPPTNCYSADITTYDAYDSSNNTIPNDADVLSTAQDVTFTITLGQTNNIGFTLSGVPVRVDADPADSTSSGGGLSTAISLTGLGAHPFLAHAYDADGNVITGLGAPVFSITASPAPAVTLTQPPSGSRRFSVTPGLHFSQYAASVALKITASFPAGETDGCAQSGASCQVQYTMSVPEPLIEYTGLTSGSHPDWIAAGADGNVWFTEGDVDQIGKITTSGVVTEYAGLTSGSGAGGITPGADGNLWFTEGSNDQIGKITTGGVVTEYTGLTSGSHPIGITAGTDGNLWFTEADGNRIGNITTSGVVTEYTGLTSGSYPTAITAGADGNLWFTETDGTRIGKITTSGVVTEYTGLTSSSAPDAIAAGPDGSLWFTENSRNQIGKITTSGVVTEYTLLTSGSRPSGITAGADGNLWFTETNGNRIGKITTGGVVTEYTGLTSGSSPSGITAGADGSVWFTEFDGNRIGRAYP